MGNPSYTLEFRIAVVKYYLSGQGGIRRTAAHCGLHKSTVSHRVASSKNIPVQATRSPVSAAKPAEKLTHDELLTGLRYLRAEVDYLKKLKALAQQKKKQK